ncbi:integrin alpha-L [Emydura macquarii macquarii]|uniref:integrin alpha-L n=1 Tax=Emydura macquarii macquarii TaxID=1129001 RepID=UPI00352A544C
MRFLHTLHGVNLWNSLLGDVVKPKVKRINTELGGAAASPHLPLVALRQRMKQAKEMNLQLVTHPQQGLGRSDAMALAAGGHPLLVAVGVLSLLRGAPPSRAFTIETQNVTIFEGDADEQFGYRVVQMRSEGSSWLVVSAPLAGNRTGALYRCSYEGMTCQPIPLPDIPPVSLGLALTSDEISRSQIMACGPRLQQRCEENIYLQGLCYLCGGSKQPPRVLHPASQACVSGVDVAVLYDDSQSIVSSDFTLMQKFIVELLRALARPRVQLAVVQFSSEINQVFSFADYATKGLSAVERDLLAYKQLSGNTYTPSAIRFVANETFAPHNGARSHAKRLLIVLTDGKSTDTETTFNEAIQAADSKDLLRYVIGVGEAFSTLDARKELLTIASQAENVFWVGNFSALSTIQEQLREKIFAIEGTAQASNVSSLQLELSQGGFSVLLAPEAIVMGAVGAYDWAGGLEEWWGEPGHTAFINDSSLGEGAKDSYLGYAVALAHRGGRALYVVGAPRYRHVGRVGVFQSRGGRVSDSVVGEQVGSYFGAELCTLDLAGAGTTDLVLIGAPGYLNRSWGGLVRVCALGDGGSLSCAQTLWGAPGDGLGRFGAALGPLGDVNGDGAGDVAVGAPMEDEGRGALYIFLGEPRRLALREPHSQRISGRSLSPALRFFAQTVQGRLDLSGDGLTDVAVGALGRAVLLRSRPVIGVSCSLVSVPTRIPLDEASCVGGPSEGAGWVSLTLCFNLSQISLGGPAPLRARISFTLQVDAGKSHPRVVLHDGTSQLLETLRVGTVPACTTKALHALPCLEDFLTPVELRVNFSVQGEPIRGTRGLSPLLSPDANRTTHIQVPFEKRCGEDKVCVADLRVSFNFSGSPGLRLSPSFLLNLTVQLENVGEMADGPVLMFQYPPGLSFGGGSVLQSLWPVSLVCNMPGAPGRLSHLNNSCQLSPPALREKTKMFLRLSFLVSSDAPWGDVAAFTLRADCRNENTTLADNEATRELPVLRPVGVVVTGLESSTYVNVSTEMPERREISHSYQVQNLGPPVIPVNVTFELPIRAALGFVWDVSVNLSGGEHRFTCTPPLTLRMGIASKTPKEAVTRGCLGASVCTRVWCQVTSLTRGESLRFNFSGDFYRAQDGTKLESRRLWLRSEASVSIDETKYFQSQPEEFQYSQITTEVELISYFNPVPVIVGSSVGGVLLLAVLVGILYKIGFFKRNRIMSPQEMPGGETVSGGQQGAKAPPESLPQPPTTQGSTDPEGAS